MSASYSARSAVNGLRLFLALSGVVSVIVGLVVLLWPGRAAEVLVGILAIYAIIAGIVYIGIGLASRTLGGWTRVAGIVLGVIFILAGIFAFANLGATTVWFGVFVGVMVGFLWIFEGVVALSTLGDSSSRGWTIFFAIVSIVAGILLLFTPLYGSLVLWFFAGFALLFMGVLQVVRAITFGKAR